MCDGWARSMVQVSVVPPTVMVMVAVDVPLNVVVMVMSPAVTPDITVVIVPVG